MELSLFAVHRKLLNNSVFGFFSLTQFGAGQANTRTLTRTLTRERRTHIHMERNTRRRRRNNNNINKNRTKTIFGVEFVPPFSFMLFIFHHTHAIEIFFPVLYASNQQQNETKRKTKKRRNYMNKTNQDGQRANVDGLRK